MNTHIGVARRDTKAGTLAATNHALNGFEKGIPLASAICMAKKFWAAPERRNVDVGLVP